MVVVPLALDCDEQWWGPAVLSFTQRILEAAPHAVDLQPREILSVSASAFPEFDCRGLYAVRLAPSALRSKDAKEVKMGSAPPPLPPCGLFLFFSPHASPHAPKMGLN